MAKRNLKFKKSSFDHIYSDDFKFDQVDSFGVVHNIAILQSAEWARTAYLFDIGFPKKASFYKNSMALMAVHTEAEYYSSAEFADDFKIFTRTSYLKNTSLGMEQIIELEDGRPIANVKIDLVYFNSTTKKPQSLSESIRHLITLHEGKKVKLLK